MASYTIGTSRKQEIGLKYSYDTYADKVMYPTQQAYLQSRVDTMTNQMFADQQRAQAASFDASFKTVPETSQPAARTEIEAVITAHGGEIVVPPPPGIPPSGPPVAGAFSVSPPVLKEETDDQNSDV